MKAREATALKPRLELVRDRAPMAMAWSEYIERRERNRRLARDVMRVCLWAGVTILTVSAMWQLGEILAGGGQ